MDIDEALYGKKGKKGLFADMMGDLDRDGVPDLFDCDPLDPKKQHIRPSRVMRERLEQLPIYFTGSRLEEGVQSPRYYTIKGEKVVGGEKVKAKKIPKDVQKARIRFLSAVKKRPEVVGEIERKKPGAVVITTKESQIDPGQKGVAYTGYDEPPIVVRATSERGVPYRWAEQQETAGTVIHELEHVRQAKAWRGRPKLEKRMKKGRYSVRREEVLAEEAEEKAYRKRHSGITEKKAKEFWEMYQKMMDQEEKEDEVIGDVS
jgi:hypothetical protein